VVVGVVVGVLVVVLVVDGSTMTMVVDVVADPSVHGSPGVNVRVTSPSPTCPPRRVLTWNNAPYTRPLAPPPPPPLPEVAPPPPPPS
jgi:hypothetical protein